MNKAVRTTVSLVVSLLLLSTLTMAQAGGQHADQHKNGKHHSRLAKLAFWRHHKDANKNRTQANVSNASKSTKTKKTPIKPASGKQVASKNDRKRTHHTTTANTASVKAPVAANKTKPRQKTQSSKAVS